MLALHLCIFALATSSFAWSDEDASQIILGATGKTGQLHEGGVSSPWHFNFSSTAPYLFSSVSSLLRQWGNTIFPNGHNIVPCEIPPFTLFYHGRRDADLPASPEWLAFDIEMSYGIMGSMRNSHMLTYQTTRPVKALYFDGESAALMGLGQLDTQMLHVFGNTSGPPNPGWGLFAEYARASGLCDWLARAGLRGDDWGYEAVIRMNAGFEMIWCNFTSPGLRLLTHLNVTAPQLPESESDGDKGEALALADTLAAERQHDTSYYSLPPQPTKTDRSTSPSNPPLPPNWRWDPDREPFLTSQFWGWLSSATYHYGSSRNGPGLGEARAKITNCGIMSYYSPSFSNLTLMRSESERVLYNLTDQGHWKGDGASGNRTLALSQLGRRRRYHHLEDATPHEASLMRSNSERVLRSLLTNDNRCTGADWVYITNEIIQNVGIHVKQLAQIVASFPEHAGNYTSLKTWMTSLRSQSHIFYVGLLEYPTEKESWDVDSKIFKDAYSRCRYRYTRLMAPSQAMVLTPEEDDLRWSVEETYGTICSVLLVIGFQIESNWAEHFNVIDADLTATGPPPKNLESSLQGLASTWYDGIQQLVAWLGWEDQFTGCTEVCGWDELCYIPMWPLVSLRNRVPRPPRNGTYPHNPHYGPPPPPHNGTGGPGGKRPNHRMPWFMMDEAELWEPSCVKIDHLMRR